MKLISTLYRKYIVANSMTSQILKLASDIMDLEYDESTEKDLLSTLEKVYEFMKQGTTADINWQQNIIKNREKKERLKEERAERNKRAQQFYKNEMPFEKKLKDKVAQEKKKQIADNIKQLDNIIQVDFKKAKQKKTEEYNFPAHWDERVKERVKSSLEKINDLMQILNKSKIEHEKK